MPKTIYRILDFAEHTYKLDTNNCKWSFSRLLEFIKARSLILSIDEKIVTRTGHLYIKVRTQIKNFGLVDSIILASSQIEKADVLTGDSHFRSFDNVRIL